jgi:putative flavoprotein involved in K+ transport
MDKLGILRKSRNSAVGGYLMLKDPFPGKELELRNLRRKGVTIVGRLAEVAGRQVSFAGGETVQIDVVIWATGYRDRTEWVAIPEAKDARGAFIEQRGISPVPGLTFVGRSWQWTRGSALLTGVGDDASYVTQHLNWAGDGSRGDGRSDGVDVGPANEGTELLVVPAARTV